MRADCFFRAYHRNKARTLSPENARFILVEVPAGASLQEILSAARAKGAPLGSHLTGVYEVQTDAGIYRRADGRKLDVTTPTRMARVTFRTWEEIEASDPS